MKSDGFYEYWIGKNIDYDTLWDAYESGQGYVQKFSSIRPHLLRITLREQSSRYPLFNFEAVYKTIQGYFHDLKERCFVLDEFNRAAPLYIYQVNRASGVWDFLSELRQLLMFGTTLSDQKMMGEKISNLDKRLEMLRKHFGNVMTREDFERFMKAKTPRQLDRALRKLFEQGIERVQVSSAPFEGVIEETEQTLIDLREPETGNASKN
jgi:hypothetical protein